jgi:hypothetical protein
MIKDPHNLWYQGLWKFLYSVSIVYPSSPSVDDKNNVYILLQTLTVLIPCYPCKTLFKQLLHSSELDVYNSSEKFQSFIKSVNIIMSKEIGETAKFYKGTISPSFWGPGLWDFLHTISINYPSNPTHDVKRASFTFLMILRKLLPCSNCRNHYIENTSNLNPEILDDWYYFSRYIFNLHNKVNLSLSKKIIYDFDFVVRKYYIG